MTAHDGGRAARERRWLASTILAILFLFRTGDAVAAPPTVTCGFEAVRGGGLADLGGRFRYTVGLVDASVDVRSTLLLLDREGNIWKELPLTAGDIIQVHLRDEHQVGGPRDGVRWFLRSPGLLVRAIATRNREQSVAYASPFAAVRVDQPIDDVVAETSSAPRAPLRILVATTMTDLKTVRLKLDCVDLLDALHASLSGTPLSGPVMVGGTSVSIADLAYDAGRNLVSLTILDLPGGDHRLEVTGAPVYRAQLPPGSNHWTRPLGALTNQRRFDVFRVQIDVPVAGAHLPTGPVLVTGHATHGREVTRLRLNGRFIPLSLASNRPASACEGAALRYDFSAVVDPANLGRDFRQGDDAPGALDPGANGLHAIATDGSHAANAGSWIHLADGNPSTARVALKHAAAPPLSCGVAAPDGYAPDGFSVGLSEHAISEMVSARLRPELCRRVTAALDKIVGCTYKIPQNACKDLCLVGTEAGLECPTGIARASDFTPVSELSFGAIPVLVDATQGPVPDQTVRALGTLQITLGRAFGQSESFQLLSPTHGHEVVAVRDEQNGWFEWRYVWVPRCEDVGTHIIRVRKTTNGHEEEISFQVTVICPEITYYRLKVLSVEPRLEDSKIETHLLGDGMAEVTISTGQIDIHVDPPKYCGDCWIFGCCCAYDPSDVRIRIPNVQFRVTLKLEDLLCGLPAGTPVTLTALPIEGVTARIADGDLTGWACDVVDVLSFGAIGQLVNFFVVMTSNISLPDLGEQIANMFESVEFKLPESFDGFKDAFDSDPRAIGSGVPLTLKTRLSISTNVEPGQGFSLGVHSSFGPSVIDSTMPASVEWVATPAPIPPKSATGDADVFFAASDDALNQMMGALTRTGVIRVHVGEDQPITIQQFASQLSPEVLTLLRAAGIADDERLLLSLDTKQGEIAVPPFVTIVDDPATPQVEIMVRAQLHTPLIFPRGEDVNQVLAKADAGTLCSCGEQLLNPSCGAACQFGSVILKLNLFADCSLIRQTGGKHALKFVVTRVQDAERPLGYAAEESFDLSAAEETTVSTAADGTLLEALRQKLNEKMPLLQLPEGALTLNGALVPIGQPWLFSVPSTNPSALGQTYLGVASHVTEVPVAACQSSPVAAASSHTVRDELTPVSTKASVPAPMARPRLRVEPNPAPAQGTTLRFTLNHDGPYTLTIYDVRGGRVTSVSGLTSGGEVRVPWNGTDQRGRKVAAGIYHAVVEASGVILRSKVILLR